ncbi:MAG: hypothetical protein ABI378_14765 [Chitinophagaceae bacterium]
MKKVALFALIIIACYGCNNDKGVYTPIDPFIKSMFNWQKDSYWIMKDSLTQQIDSFVVDTFSRQIRNASYSGTYEYVYISVLDYDLNRKNLVSNWYVELGQRQGQNSFGYGDISSIDTQIYVPDIFPCPLGYSDFNFNIGIKNFSHVYFNSTLFYWKPDSFLSLYMNQSNGLIKVDIKLYNYRRVWELERAKIIN